MNWVIIMIKRNTLTSRHNALVRIIVPMMEDIENYGFDPKTRADIRSKIRGNHNTTMVALLVRSQLETLKNETG